MLISGKPLQFNTLCVYKLSSPEEYMLFQLSETGDLFVCDLSFGGNLRTHESRFSFIPIIVNDTPISVSSHFEGPFHMCILQKNATILVMGTIKGVSLTSDIEDRIGVARLTIATSPLVSTPTFTSLAGNVVEKTSLLNRMGSYYRNKEVFSNSVISVFAKSPDETHIAILTTTGIALLFDIPENKVISRYPALSDTESEAPSFAGLSVVNPIDYTRVNSLAWWNEDVLLVTTLQGDAVLMHWRDWSLLMREWQRSTIGCLATCREGIVLLVNDHRTVLENADGCIFIQHRLHFTSIQQVNPWQRYLAHIEAKEYGEALKLATAHQLDTDLIYKYKVCTLHKQAPALRSFWNTPLLPEGSFSPVPLECMKYEEIDPVLSRIRDIPYVLKHMYCTTIGDRSGTINIIKSGLRRCNQYLADHHFTVPMAKEVDILQSCQRKNYSYTLEDIQQDETLQWVVLMKYLFCQKLMRIRFYNSISTLSQGYTGFNCNEFNLLYSGDFLSLCKQFALQGDVQRLLRCMTSFPQYLLPYRYTLLERIPYVTDPMTFASILPQFKGEMGEVGMFYYSESGVMKAIQLLHPDQVEWYETIEIIQYLKGMKIVDENENMDVVLTEYLNVTEVISKESTHQQDPSFFVQWILQRCIEIDRQTGLVEYARSLCQAALQQPPFYENSELIAMMDAIDLLSLYHNQVYSINHTVDLFSKEVKEITLEAWLNMSNKEMIHQLFSMNEGDYKGMVDFLVSNDLVKCEYIVEYLNQTIEEGNVPLFVAYVKYIEKNQLTLMLKSEVEEFLTLFEHHIKSPSYAFNEEHIQDLLSIVSSILKHPLVTSQRQQQQEELQKLLSIALNLREIVTYSLGEIDTILQKESAWCQEHPIQLVSASISEIKEYLSLQSVQLIKDYYKQKQPSFKQVQSFQEICFGFLPPELINYILLPMMITENTLSSLNSASNLTENINSDWLNEILLRSVNDRILSMNTYSHCLLLI